MRKTAPTLLLSCFLSIPAFSADRLIRVNGDALIEVKPDYAVVHLNLEARDRLLKRARSVHDADVSAVRHVATSHKIAPADIAQDFPEVETTAEGFLLRRTVQLTVRDLQDYDAVLFDLYDSAAITVAAVEFRLNDVRKFRDQARDLAIRAAQDKAQLMVTALQRRVGRLMDVRVETGGGVLIRRRGQTMRDNMQAAVQNVSVAAGNPNAPAGGGELFRVPVTARVDVEYEIIE